MNSCELILFITSVSIIIADQFPNNDELALLASSFNQLGDTLTTISIQRELKESPKSEANDLEVIQAV